MTDVNDSAKPGRTHNIAYYGDVTRFRIDPASSRTCTDSGTHPITDDLVIEILSVAFEAGMDGAFRYGREPVDWEALVSSLERNNDITLPTDATWHADPLVKAIKKAYRAGDREANT